MLDIHRNNPLKDVSNLLKRKTRRPMIIQDVDSDNDIPPREAELEFENLNLNFDKYCFLCHKEITFTPEEHPFFRCITCSKYYHRDCYKEYNLKQTEKDLCKSVIRINKAENPTENNLNKNENALNKNKIFGKECILCIMQNSNFCTICKNKITEENNNDLIIQCELCGNLMHYKCLDVPLYFIFYRELYKNIFINLGISPQIYKEFLLKIKDIKNNYIGKELLMKIYDEFKIIPTSSISNYLFYICSFCKTRNLYDLQEINVFNSTSFSKVNFYNTALNPLSQNVNKIKTTWNMNKIHELYILSSNPYNEAQFDSEKYDSNYVTPKPVKIIKKYEYNRVNNIIIKNSPLNNINTVINITGVDNDENNNNSNIPLVKKPINEENISKENELDKDGKENKENKEENELSNIVQMFEEGEQKKLNEKNNTNNNEINSNNNNNKSHNSISKQSKSFIK